MADQPQNPTPHRGLLYDDVIHATNGTLPLCDDAMIPACAPESTTLPVTCIWCLSLVS